MNRNAKVGSGIIAGGAIVMVICLSCLVWNLGHHSNPVGSGDAGYLEWYVNQVGFAVVALVGVGLIFGGCKIQKDK